MIVKTLIRLNSSQPVTTTCMSHVTGSYAIPVVVFGISINVHVFVDIKICKWQYNNGTDYYNNSEAAKISCENTGYAKALWSTGYIQNFLIYGQQMLEKYIASSYCGR